MVFLPLLTSVYVPHSPLWCSSFVDLFTLRPGVLPVLSLIALSFLSLSLPPLSIYLTLPCSRSLSLHRRARTFALFLSLCCLLHLHLTFVFSRHLGIQPIEPHANAAPTWARLNFVTCVRISGTSDMCGSSGTRVHASRMACKTSGGCCTKLLRRQRVQPMSPPKAPLVGCNRLHRTSHLFSRYDAIGN